MTPLMQNVSKSPTHSPARDALVPIVRGWLVLALSRRGEAAQQARARAIVDALVALIDERIEASRR